MKTLIKSFLASIITLVFAFTPKAVTKVISKSISNKIVLTTSVVIITVIEDNSQTFLTLADTIRFKPASYTPTLNVWGFTMGFDGSGIFYDAPRPDYRFNIDYPPLLGAVATSSRYDDLIFSPDLNNLPVYYHKYESDTLHKLFITGKNLSLQTGTLVINTITIPSITSTDISTALGANALTSETQSLSLSGQVVSIKSGSIIINTITIPTQTTGLALSSSIPINNNQLSNGSGYLTSEIDGSITNEIELPSQTLNNGKYLTTNGTSPFWSVIASQVTQTLVGNSGITITSGSNTYTISGKSINTYTGTTDASGNFSVTFSTSFSSNPYVMPSIPNQTDKNELAITSTVTTTGFMVNVFTRPTVTTLPIIGTLTGALLGATTTPVSGRIVKVVVIE